MIDEEGDIKQPSQLFDMGVVGIAAVLTLCGVAMCFFTFTVPTDKAPRKQDAPQEVTLGIGQGSAIHPDKPAAH